MLSMAERQFSVGNYKAMLWRGKKKKELLQSRDEIPVGLKMIPQKLHLSSQQQSESQTWCCKELGKEWRTKHRASAVEIHDFPTR